MKKHIAILSLFVLFAFCSCNKIMLSGNNITETFSVEGTYTELQVENAFDVTVSDTATQITITTDENVMPMVVVEKVEGKLYIHLKPLTLYTGKLDLDVILPYNADLKSVNLSGASEFHSIYGLTGEKIEVKLSGASEFYGNLEANEVKVDLSGASDFYGNIVATEFDAELSGASDIEGNVTATEFDLDMSGASEATLVGQVTTLEIDLEGASRVIEKVVENKYALVCDNCEGEMSGASSAYIHCDGTIRVNLSGASYLHFTGEAFTADSNTSGGSKIIHENP